MIEVGQVSNTLTKVETLTIAVIIVLGIIPLGLWRIFNRRKGEIRCVNRYINNITYPNNSIKYR